MRKLTKIIISLDVVLLLVLFGGLLCDRQILSTQLIRLHVVADSDSAFDQSVKLRVRDAVNAYIEENMQTALTTEQAKQFLANNLSAIEEAANQTLLDSGSTDTARVTLCREEFPIRHYDSFTLPSGVYESLRVTIGEGEGQNWWCVVFPSLCLPAAGESLRDTAAGAGFPETLTDTLTGESGYELSFFLLDCLGKLQNFFHFG